MKKPSERPWVTGLAFASILSLAGCSDSSTAPSDAPEGHTVVKSGVAHAPGLTNPVTNCTQCHGADLRGGAEGQPSCFSCHGEKW